MNKAIVSNLPKQFHISEIYNTYLEEYDGEIMELIHSRPLKLDDKYESFQDILHILDTCAYLGCDLPWNVFDFAYSAPLGLSTFMKQFMKDSDNNSQSKYEEYYHFAKTPEFAALQLCCEYTFDESLQTQPLVYYAIQYGSLLLIKYFEYKCEYLFLKNLHTLWLTVQYGRIDIFEYFTTKSWFYKMCDTTFHKYGIIQNAITYSQVKMLEFLHKKLEFPITSELIDDAINKLQYECLVYLLENGVKPTEYSLGIAVCISDVKYTVAIVEAGASVDNDSYTLYAAQRGRIDVLQYLHSRSAPWHENAVNAAARSVSFGRKFRQCAEFGLQCNAPFNSEIIQKYLYREKWVQKMEMLGLSVPTIYPTDDVWMLDLQ
jgi:hypothetical protein